VTEIPDILDIGCGHRKLPGAWAIDALDLPGIDQVHDLDVFPWPVPDAHFRWVRAMEVLEHVDDFMGCMDECYRVLRPGGRLTIKMPFMGSVHHHTDPTHRRAATSRSLDYFLADQQLAAYDYARSRFTLVGFEYVREVAVRPPVGWIVQKLDRVVLPFLERHHDIYEHYFTGFYPVHSITFELKKA